MGSYHSDLPYSYHDDSRSLAPKGLSRLRLSERRCHQAGQGTARTFSEQPCFWLLNTSNGTVLAVAVAAAAVVVGVVVVVAAPCLASTRTQGKVQTVALPFKARGSAIFEAVGALQV